MTDKKTKIWIVAKQENLVRSVESALRAHDREFRLLGSEVEARVELQALRRIKNNPNLPDLIIAENDMGRNDAGLDVVRNAQNGTDKVPVIIMSVGDRAMLPAVEAGAVGYFDRHNSYTDLKIIVDDILSKAASRGRNP